MLLKFRGAGGVQSRLASPVIDPPVWRNNYQGGALELPVNVALLALGAILARAPIFVNRPTPPPAPQIDVYPNIAVGFQSTQLAGEYIDPVRYKPVPSAPDIYPNLAVNAQTQRPAGTYIEPQTWKGWPTPDIYPNVSAKTETVPIPRAPLYTVTWKSQPPQIDIYPNVAGLRVLPPRPAFLALNEPQIWKPLPPQIDVYPNLAAKTEVVPIPRAPFYTVTWKGTPPQSDIFPNIAAMLSPAIGNITTWQDLAGGKWTPVELYPNVAVRVQQVTYQPPPFLEQPLSRKYPVQIDLPPNIAVTQVTTPLTRAALFVTTPWKGWAAPDFYPNVAVNTPAAPVLIRSTPEPTYTSKWTVPIEYPPNIAVQFTVIPPVVVPPVVGGTGSDDKDTVGGDDYRRKAREILHLKKLKSQREKLVQELKQVEVEIVEVRTERVEAEVKTQDLLQQVDELTAHLEQVSPGKAKKLLEKQFSLDRARVIAQEKAYQAILKEQSLEREKLELKKKLRQQEEQEAMEAMMILMMMDEEDS